MWNKVEDTLRDVKRRVSGTATEHWDIDLIPLDSPSVTYTVY